MCLGKREKGLGFVPLVQERYHLVCLKSELASPPVTALLNELQSSHWLNTLETLPGYNVDGLQTGKVLSLRAVLPWWHYRRPKLG